MTRTPIRIVVWAEEPCQAAYLETVLEMEAPGLVDVAACSQAAALPRRAVETGCDLVLLAVAGDADVAPEAAWDLPLERLGAPAIVVLPWLPAFAQVHQLMRLGAEDVLGLAELSPRRLVAAIVKAVERRSRRGAVHQRLPPPAQPHFGAVPPALGGHVATGLVAGSA
ncbi:MAG TPA: hypothetical protein VHI93_06960 [Candidatus Thermoplasmatota archaeon]|nr:hypothetical protein [Candidatus Thermoplasmatota archaeon]